MLFRILLVILILLAIDFYVYQGVRLVLRPFSITTYRITGFAYWSVTLVAVTILLLGFFTDWHTWNKAIRTYSFAFVVIIYLSKIFVVLFLVVDDVLRIFRWTGSFVSDTFFHSPGKISARANGISRFEFLTKLGLFIGAIPFVSLIFGMINGAYDYRVRKVTLKFPHLPGTFKGLRILQFSDLHSGSFMGTNHLEKAVQLMLEQKPDVIFFTGDLVNDLCSEAVEFRETLKKIKAPLGVYSILGNHDYGDYYRWKTMDEKKENLERLKKFHGELGWNILLNNHTFIEKSGEKIGLIGVENWSHRATFKRYGDMKKATEGMTTSSFNILLSHDPSHWNAEITEHYPSVDLTLSGHTHGFQFGVEIPGFKWSPVQYMYKEWADLYQKNHQYLYVNRGLGFIGYPGRVGILPEITVIDLLQT
ncbi:MAG: metallophosphoesterase [Bacteroidetes bacterium]|nr:metallophosphoesterase [Bacteroidota bacterium]